MKIINCKIEDFGVLHNYDTGELSSGINLFYGPNEAGKSTLKDFVVALLFALPRSDNPEYHQALHAGRHGGKITLLDDNDTLLNIEGFARRIVRNDSGEELNISTINQILGGVDKDLFSSVFAFGLKELADLKLLDKEKVNEFLFNTAVLGAGSSASEVERGLNDKLNDLWSTRRKNPAPINGTLTKIKALDQELKGAQNEQKKSVEIQKNIVAIDKELDDLKKKEQAITHEISKLETFNQLKARSDLQRAHEEIASYLKQTEYYKDILDLSEDIKYLSNHKEKYLSEIKRLDEIGVQIEEKKLIFAGLQEGLKDVDTESAPLPNTMDIKNVELQLKNQESDQSTIDNWINSIQTLDRGIAGNETKFRDTVNSLQSNIFPKYLSQTEIYGVLIHLFSANNLSISADNLGSDTAGYLCDQQFRSSYINNLIEQFSQWLDVIKQLKIKIEKQEQHNNKIISLKSELARIAKIAELKQSQPKSVYLVFAASAILSLLASLIAFIKADLLEALPAFIAFLFISLGIYLLQLEKQKRFSLSQNLEGQYDATTSIDITSQLTALSEALHMTDSQTLPLEREINTLAQMLHITATSKAELEGLEHHIDSLYQSITVLKKLQEDTTTKKNEIQDLEQKIAETKISLADKKNNLSSIYTRYAISDVINLELLPDIMRELGKFFSIKKEYEELKQTEQSLTEEVRSFEFIWKNITGKILNIFNSIDMPDTGIWLRLTNKYSKSFTQESSYYKSFQDFIAGNQNAKELFIRIRETVESVGRLTTTMESGRYSLIANTVEDLVSLYSTASHWIKSCDHTDLTIKELNQNIEDNLQAVQSSSTEYNEYLQHGDDQQLEDLHEQLQQNEEERDKKQDARGQYKNELMTLTSSEKIADLELRLENQKALLNELLKQYLTYSFASWAIQNTLRRYEEEKQPDLLKRTGELFSLVTNGRYAKVFFEINSKQKKTLKISDGNTAFPAENLSQGTREELYLCLRIAYAENFAKHGKNLPFIFDDILVNFDQKRTEQAIKLLHEASLKRQIIAFTCHDHIKELFLAKSSESNVKVFTLPESA
ncbi:MAG: AAA family ATPase [Firmicutes bacterium]|jgi:uncharacterized protein YhaN|nr:AAA family ATPase [Bacillota bacterium]